MNFEIKSFKNNGKIPEKYAFCKPDENTVVTFSDNINPHLIWSDVPLGTKSLAIVCYDSDVPSVGDDVNQAGKTVSASLPRVNFYHWLLANIPININEIPEGAISNKVVTRGKKCGDTDFGFAGINNYTDWFANDEDMKGIYADYDGPCPPWNDEIIHHYHFELYALDTVLDLPKKYNADDFIKNAENHILDKKEWIGTYTLNKKLK